MIDKCNKNNKKFSRFGLTLFFSVISLVAMILTLLIAFICFWGIHYFNLVREPKTSDGIMLSILLFVFMSVIIGSVISFVVSRIPLKPIRQIIKASNELANGNFKARINIKIPGEIKELNDSFNHMAQELESIEILRSDFVNNFSHEFKTPIVSIQGFAKMLRHGDLSEEERKEYLDTIISESERLANLATNVLNFSKIENQTILTDRSDYNVSEQLRRTIAILEPKWSKKKIDFVFDCDEITINANEQLMEQVWINLIDNAIKFSPEYSPIKIRITDNERMTVITVADMGMGISKEALEHIFDKFYKADKSHSGMGNGLGLAIAKKIIDLHEGKIEVESEVDKGTKFDIVIYKY